MAELGKIAMGSWYGLGLTSGFRPWERAAEHFARLLRPFRNEQVSEEAIHNLHAVVERSQTEALIDLDHTEHSRVKLMTYHQTKSREADTVIHVYRQGDFFGREGGAVRAGLPALECGDHPRTQATCPSLAA